MLNQQSEAPRVIEGRDTLQNRYALTVTERVKGNPVYRKTGGERRRAIGYAGRATHRRAKSLLIREKRELSADTDKELSAFLDNFAKSFA